MQESSSNSGRSTRAWVLAWAVAIVLLASVPYLWGIRVTPPGHRFLGLTHNIDDGAVYLSWMRQIADGHLTFRNLFTNEPTHARQFNLLFLLMGGTARVTCLPLVWVFHIFRAGLGVLLMLAIWRFSKLFLESENERRLLIPLVGLSAGIGWLMPVSDAVGPVDTWQPEAITFLSIYLNPLFLAGLILMIGSFHFLLLTERTGQARHAVCAGLCMLVLGNVHTYDVLTVATVWTCYLIVLAVTERRFPMRTVLLSVLAGLIAIPSIAYQWRLYQFDPVFRARANSPAPSPAIWCLFAGYGLVLLGAVAGAALVLARRRTNSQFPIPNSQLLIVWSVIGFALPYAPIAQQRKLVMGLHIPLCILCAYALCRLTQRMPRTVGRGIVLAFILFSAGSNVGFLTQDMNLLSIGRTVTIYQPFMGTDELAAMRFIRRDPDTNRSVFAPPTFALFTPALTGHQVYHGHWSETPDYPDKLREWMDFVSPAAPPDYRADIQRRTGAAYYVSVGRESLPPEWLIGHELFPEFGDGQVTVYRARVPVP